MSDLTNACSTLTVSGKYSELYKTAPRIDQNKRREDLLAEQKRRRENLVDEARGLCDTSLPRNESKYKNKITKEFRNKLMLSEWFEDVPPDFDVAWCLKFCPTGHRNLVVANKNVTKSYSKYGRFEQKFHSVLPGSFSGYNNSGCSNSGYKTTILDCIWNKETNSFYILDVLMWYDYNLIDYDAEFRFFWLQSKLSEIPELEIVSSRNTYSFYYVPHLLCDITSLSNAFMNYPRYDNNTPAVDGLLFYHKEASYMSGRTPLVGWLKPYMVPEVLKISVANAFHATRPDKYVNLPLYLEYLAQKKQKGRKVEMDVS